MQNFEHVGLVGDSTDVDAGPTGPRGHHSGRWKLAAGAVLLLFMSAAAAAAALSRGGAADRGLATVGGLAAASTDGVMDIQWKQATAEGYDKIGDGGCATATVNYPSRFKEFRKGDTFAKCKERCDSARKCVAFEWCRASNCAGNCFLYSGASAQYVRGNGYPTVTCMAKSSSSCLRYAEGGCISLNNDRDACLASKDGRTLSRGGASFRGRPCVYNRNGFGRGGHRCEIGFHPAYGFESQAEAVASCPKQETICDEASWPDKDHGLVCGECKVLVTKFNTKYKTCNKYCSDLGRRCTGAWDEDGDTCRVRSTATCDQTLGRTSDAICECGRSSGDEATDFVTPESLMTCPGNQGNRGIRKTQHMTGHDYDVIARFVVQELTKLPDRCTSRECPQADFAGCVLRIAGHDFMDFKDGKGGSDGCTDLADPDNVGLPDCLATGEVYDGIRVSVKNAYQQFCDTVSLADFLVIAAEALMRHLQPSESRPLDFKSSFRFGRTTAAEDCKYEFQHKILPDAEGSCSEVDRVFVQNMGLTTAEATALSGVHTLGRARQFNSGYEGFWSDPENSRRFNNNYFVSILAKGWAPKLAVGGNRNKNMWVRSDVDRNTRNGRTEMMLNTDMCLAYFQEGEGLDASKHSCCAWFNPEFFSQSRQILVGLPKEVTKANGNQLCGNEILEFGVPSRTVCCESFSDQLGGNFESEDLDCGSPDVVNGLGGEDLILFAQHENAWLNTFQSAWRKATENGRESDLKRLA